MSRVLLEGQASYITAFLGKSFTKKTKKVSQNTLWNIFKSVSILLDPPVERREKGRRGNADIVDSCGREKEEEGGRISNGVRNSPNTV